MKETYLIQVHSRAIVVYPERGPSTLHSCMTDWLFVRTETKLRLFALHVLNCYCMWSVFVAERMPENTWGAITLELSGH